MKKTINKTLKPTIEYSYSIFEIGFSLKLVKIFKNQIDTMIIILSYNNLSVNSPIYFPLSYFYFHFSF